MATEEPIQAIFAKFGTIKEIRMFSAQNFGFIVFGDKTQATQAIIEMHGKELDLGIVAGKCKLRVKWGKPIQHGSTNGVITGIRTTNSENGNNNDGNATNTEFVSKY
jgi:RNA recognition motif-containing protein